MIDTLAATPHRVRELLDGLSEEQLSLKPADGRFSLRENVLHLRDIDVDGYEKRLARILRESHPRLADVDGARLARERDYNAQPVTPALETFERSRAASIEWLRGIDERDFERTAEMEGVGTVSLRRLVEMWLQHDTEHLEEMRQLRAAHG